MKVAMAQINPIVGDIKGNLAKVLEMIKESKEQGAEIVAFPEMVITGYPPQDLLHENLCHRSRPESVLHHQRKV